MLLKQEPFGWILEETLMNYWSRLYGVNYSVKFREKAFGKLFSVTEDQQVWFGNIYLNFFTVAETPKLAFDNLKAEYQHTPTRWRRWPQKAYVNCAISSMLRKFLAQVSLHVSPAIPEAEDTLVLGGNRRLRLLHPVRGMSTVLLKHGYPSNYLTEDVSVRQHLALNFSPKLGRVAVDDGWYEEEYVKGTPLNRLVACDMDALKEEVHALLLNQVVDQTCEDQKLLDYVAQVVLDIEHLLSNEHVDLESKACVSTMMQEIIKMAEKLGSTSTEIPVSMTHGDFQQANILYDGHKLTVIDWECVARRHAAYDVLVYQLGVRQTLQWPDYLKAFITCPPVGVWKQWPGLSSQRERLLSALIFILDELRMTVDEALEVSFRRSCLKHLPFKSEQLRTALILLDDVC